MIYSINVLDEKGNPVPNCKVGSSVFVKWQSGEGFGRDVFHDETDKTDAKGLVTFNMKSSRQDMNYMVYPTEEFYSDSGDTYDFRPPVNGVWQPENEKITVILKRRKNPIAMYAKKGPGFLPVVDKDLGYDLMIGDWVKPHGKGVVSDLIFHIKIDKVSESEFTSVLSILFPNEGDGMVTFEASYNKGSRLRSAYKAPEKGYVKSLVHTREIKPKQKEKDTRSENANYYIRVRTELDDKGNVASAHYGKIYGDFMKFTHYLNPTPNDRNVELDPKKNLISTGFRGHKVQNP